MWREYYSVSSVDEAIQLLSVHKQRSRIVAGATDLILELERGLREGVEILIDISRVSELAQITLDENGVIHLGAMVTHNQCIVSDILRKSALLLVQACWQVGSPQIRNRGTVAGNLITASPANDTITPLIALGASLVLRSSRGSRTVPLHDFYRGVRKTIMRDDEMVAEILIPKMTPGQRGIFLKSGLRSALIISVSNVAVILELRSKIVISCSIALGSVAPTIIHAISAENYLTGKELTSEAINKASDLTQEAIRPISDIRGSEDYRYYLVRTLVKQALDQLANGVDEVLPEEPVLLSTQSGKIIATEKSFSHIADTPIETTINNQAFSSVKGQGKTLLRFLREEAGLTGTKEGCGEGECGACTVFLDGQAVMSCLVPAPRAHNADITTIEGIAREGDLHPIQNAFISKGAVQCGYCTPGFVMSSVKLLDEVQNPTKEQIIQAITGNLCRCTGYFKIIEAIESAVSGGMKNE